MGQLDFEHNLCQIGLLISDTIPDTICSSHAQHQFNLAQIK